MSLMERIRGRQGTAPMQRWEDPLSSLRRDVDQLIENMWSGWPRAGLATNGEFFPTVDIEESDKAVEVTAELPGVASDDIDVTLSNDGTVLMIRGEKRFEEEKKTETTFRSERRYGMFRRSISLPAMVDPERVEARCKDGVLRIKLVKASEEVRGVRHIAVKSA